MNKWKVKALIELEYEVDYNDCNYGAEAIELSEIGEIEIQLDKTIPLYQDFDINIKQIKAIKKGAEEK
jgi:hypothetical protein